jgi:ABC-type Mn2+/Zn2+ transport system ATPase subunit
MDPLVRLVGVTCAYGRREPAITGVDLTIGAGDFIGVVGPSGSGKTTLLKAIAGVIVPVSGSCRRAPSARFGYVPQVDAVNWYFPCTVRQAVLMARVGHRLAPWPSRTDAKEAEAVLERLGLGGLGGRHIRELSGGQQQRMFVARALLRRANILLLDEPTSGIDVRARHDVLHVLHELHHDGMAVVLSTHDLNGIAAHLPYLLCLNKAVTARGAPHRVMTPAVLERTYGAPVEVLSHAGMPVVVDVFDSADEPNGSPGLVVAPEGHHGHPV